MQKNMAASRKETKKLNSSPIAIKGELNKLKRPAATPPDKELQLARKRIKCLSPKTGRKVIKG